MIALLVITDGRRECIERTIDSASALLVGNITTKVIWDDSGDDVYARWLERFQAYGFTVVRGAGRSGFGGAIRGAWSWLQENTSEPFIWHQEDDFVFNRAVSLGAIAGRLATHPYLAQLALRRQPWNSRERAAGGVVEQYPKAYEDCDDGEAKWLEHRLFFTTNPCLYRRPIMDVGWPDRPESEGHFTHKLRNLGFDGIAGSDVRFGFWGGRDSGEWVTHIGVERVGVGY